MIKQASQGTGPRSHVLEVKGLCKAYGEGPNSKTILGDVTFDVMKGELLSVVGPSGAGKTTLLNCIGGLLKPSAGVVMFNGEAVTSSPEQMAMVFQDYSRSLLPWMSVLGNVTLPLRRTIPNRAKREEVARHALASVGLGESGSLKPYQLSGGMQQRVAIARALAYQPLLLVMDEPFASVDAQTREELEDLTLRLKEEYAMTIVLVTHDIDEAVYMSDRVVVLAGKPTAVFDTLEVGLGSQRDQIDTKGLPAFGHLRARVHAGIRGQSLEQTTEA